MAWSKTPGDVQLINISARLFIETDNQSCETFDQSVGEIDRWKGKQGKCRPMRSTQPIWLSDVASRKLTEGEGGRERGREKERIPWNWLTSWLSRGLRNNFVPSNQPPPLCTPRPRTSLAHPYNREARIGKGYITFRSTYNEARAYQGEPVRSLSFNTSDADDVNVLADFLSCRARSRYQFFSSRRCERRTNIFHTFS